MMKNSQNNGVKLFFNYEINLLQAVEYESLY